MSTLQKVALYTRKKTIDDKLKKLEEDRLRAIESEQVAQSRKEAENLKNINLANKAKDKEVKARREDIDKEIEYHKECLDQINTEIQELNTPVVIDFTSDTQANSTSHADATEATESYRQEIYDKQHYYIDKKSLLVLKIAIALILASIIGKLSASNTELIENLVSFTYFADMDSLGSFGIFIDFSLQEFLLVFILTGAFSLLMRNEGYIHNPSIKYLSIWVILISMFAIIILSTL